MVPRPTTPVGFLPIGSMSGVQNFRHVASVQMNLPLRSALRE
jgi:hypothetical protein